MSVSGAPAPGRGSEASTADWSLPSEASLLGIPSHCTHQLMAAHSAPSRGTRAQSHESLEELAGQGHLMRRSHSTELVPFPWAENQTSFLDTLPGCQESDVQVGALSFKKNKSSLGKFQIHTKVE